MGTLPNIDPHTALNVDVPALVKSFGDVAAAGADAVKSVLEHPENLTDQARAGINTVRKEIGALVDGVGDKTRDVIDKLIELAKASPQPEPPAPVDVRRLLKEVASAVAEAEAILNAGVPVGHGLAQGGGLVIAGGTIEIDVQVAIPGGGPGASARLRFEIKPKPYG